MKEAEFGTLDYHIEVTGVQAAEALIPKFDWNKIRSSWKDTSQQTRAAALVLRRKQLTNRVNLLMAAKVINEMLSDGKELYLAVLVNGSVVIRFSDKLVWGQKESKILYGQN